MDTSECEQFEVTSFKHFSFEKPFNIVTIEGFLKTEVFKTGHFEGPLRMKYFKRYNWYILRSHDSLVYAG